MTAKAMIEEMKAKGYATQYSSEELIEMFSTDMIKRFYDKFMEYIKGGQK